MAVMRYKDSLGNFRRVLKIKKLEESTFNSGSIKYRNENNFERIQGVKVTNGEDWIFSDRLTHINIVYDKVTYSTLLISYTKGTSTSVITFTLKRLSGSGRSNTYIKTSTSSSGQVTFNNDMPDLIGGLGYGSFDLQIHCSDNDYYTLGAPNLNDLVHLSNTYGYEDGTILVRKVFLGPQCKLRGFGYGTGVFIGGSFLSQKEINTVITASDNLEIPPNAFLVAKIKKFIAFKNITNINIANFYGISNLEYFDFSRVTIIPELGHRKDDHVLNYMPSTCKIKVPSLLYNDWIIHPDWIEYADQIIAI